MRNERKVLSLLLAVLLCLSLLPMGALAEEEAAEAVTEEYAETVIEEAEEIPEEYAEPDTAPEAEEIADAAEEETAEETVIDEDVQEEPLPEEDVSEEAEDADAPEEPIDSDSAEPELEAPALDGETITSGDYEYTITNGVAVLSKYKGSASSVTIPTSVTYGGTTYKVRTVAASAFEGNTSLKTLIIPEGIQNLGNCAFKNCTNLSSIAINGDIGDCHYGSTDWNSYYDYAVFYNAGANSNSLTVTFGDSVTRIPGYLFGTRSSKSDGYYAHVTKLIIGKNVTEVGGRAFCRCYDLESITWGSSIATIEPFAFYLTGLSSVALPSKVSTVGEYAFGECISLKTLVLPASVKKLGDCAFKSCTNLSSITINGDIGDCHYGSTDWNSYYDYAVFYNAGANSNSLTVTFGDSVTRIPAYLFGTNSSKSDGYYAHVTKLVIGNNVTEIGGRAFALCYDLTSVTWGNSLTYIGAYAFKSTNLSTVNIPSKVTSIDENAFLYCTNLKTLVLPSSVKKLGNCAFGNCTNLSSITINGDIGDCHYGSTDYSSWYDYAVFYNAGTSADSMTVTFGDGVTRIPAYIFGTRSSNSDNTYAHLTKLIIPKTLNNVGKNAFYSCYDLKTVQYKGSSSDWNAITIADGNTYLTGANIQYNYSQTVTYTVSYNANGGTGAPATQTKTQGVALTLSSVKPTRSGYTFQGWATSNSATTAQYQPGGSYSNNASVTLYAVWKADPVVPSTSAALSVSSAAGSKGSTVTLAVSIKNNPGVAFLNFNISYDTTRLQLVSAADGGMNGWTVNVGSSGSAAWYSDKNSTYNGDVLRLTFKVLDNAPDGAASVRLTGVSAYNAQENEVGITATNGSVTVSSKLSGDVNGDGKVDGRDIIRLAQFFAGYSVTINSANADVTGNGTVDGRDIIRLAQYFAGYSVELQ